MANKKQGAIIFGIPDFPDDPRKSVAVNLLAQKKPIKEVSRVTKASCPMIRDWQTEPEFAAALSDARSKWAAQHIDSLKDSVPEAVKYLRMLSDPSKEIDDSGSKIQARLAGIKLLMSTVKDLRQSDLERKIAELERIAK